MAFPTPDSALSMGEETLAKPFEISERTGTLIGEGAGGWEIAASVGDDVATTIFTALPIASAGEMLVERGLASASERLWGGTFNEAWGSGLSEGMGEWMVGEASSFVPRGSVGLGALARFEIAMTPWHRQVYQRLNIDWALVRPAGTRLAGMTNRAAARMGYAPGRINPLTGKWDDVVLHHALDNPRGALIETWRSSHTRFHNTIGRAANDFNEFSGLSSSWRTLRPTWADAFSGEQHGYWAWRMGARPNLPVRPRLLLPGD
jgi:hypothetical protein